MNNGLQGFPRKQPKVSGGGLPPDGNYTDVTVSGGGSVWTINNNVVTFAKMQNIATQRVLGRGTAGTGNVEEISLASSLVITGTTLGVVADTTRQLTKVQLNGVDVGSRSQMDYADSATGIEWTVTDDGTEIDISFDRGSWSVVGNMSLDVIAGATVSYWSIMGGQIADNTTETNRIVYWPKAGEFQNLYVRTNNAQPGTGAYRVYLRVGLADSAIVATIAAGSAAGSYSDTTHTVANAEGDEIAIKGDNAAATNSATSAWTIAWRPST